MRTKLILTLMILPLLWISAPAEGLAWIGLELDGKLTGVADPYEATGSGGGGGLWETSGRVMYQGSFGSLDVEIHWLGTVLGASGGQSLPPLLQENPFRRLDLEDVHSSQDRTAIESELDRLSLTLKGKDLRATVGRQAVSWGEAYYFNIGDLFGAFPITETNRLYKSGIDALAVTANLGPFSNLSFVFAPSDGGDDSAAGRLLLPFGPGSLTVTAGSILEDEQYGAGYSVDVKGTRVYGDGLFTSPEDDEDFSELVLGAERQIGPYTHFVGEIYYNGWGTDSPDEYTALLVRSRYLQGRALTLGRLSAALEFSRQVSPLVNLTPALFANLSDGSALLRIDGSYSASDLTTLTGGLFLGLGERPEGTSLGSEYGAAPTTVYLEIVTSL